MDKKKISEINEIIKRQIRPSLNEHGGDIEFVEVTAEGFVKIKLTGACSTCPGAQQTLTDLVETKLKSAMPEIRGVIPTHQISEELIQDALKILRRDKR